MIKHQNTNNKQNPIGQKFQRVYDLEERTFLFAKNCALFCKKLPKNTSNIIYSDQLTRSSGSTAANYIEANEALNRKDIS